MVDVVDISPGMLEAGRNINGNDNNMNMRSKLRFFEADVTKPLDHLPLLQQNKYDVVMANWIFSFIGTLEEIESAFSNIKRYLKPGGRFISVSGCGSVESGAEDGEIRRVVQRYQTHTRRCRIRLRVAAQHPGTCWV